jgi:hypothetical protein
MKNKLKSSEKEQKDRILFNRNFPLAGQHPLILMGLGGGGFGGGRGFYGNEWNYGSGGPTYNDNIPPSTSYNGDEWGNYHGYGSPDNPMQLDAVTITPAQQNSPSAWADLGWTIASIAEVVAGIAVTPETGGAGVYLIIDGITRTGLNFTNFVNHIKAGNVPTLPTNFGGAIGLAFSGETGAYYGSLANDIITALVGGGAFQSAWDAAVAIKNSNVLLGIANGTLSIGSINSAVTYVENWYQNHQ